MSKATVGLLKGLPSYLIEKLTGYLAFITSDHAYIHAGKAFTAILNTGSISASYKVAFKTPTVASGKFVHWRPLKFTTSANYVQYTLYEGDTYTGGTAITPINRNRNLKLTHLTTMQAFVKGVTSTPTGTIMDSGGIGTSGVPAASGGGSMGAVVELLLTPNTVYVLDLVPAGATVVTGKLFWYEESFGS
jgi:hypothetical protein